jgi:PKD domain/SprB repeat
MQIQKLIMTRAILTVLLAGFVSLSEAQSPGGVSSGLYLWLNGDVGTSSSNHGDALSFWNDQSGNGHHATQNTVSARPNLFVSSLNGHNAIQTNGGGKYFNVDLSGIDNHAFTVFTLIKRNSAIVNQFVLGTQMSVPDPGLHIGYVADNRLRHGQYGERLNRSVATFAGAQESPRLIYAECDNNYNQTVSEVREGIKLVNDNLNTAHYPSTAQGVIGRGSATFGLSGYIAEVIIYDRELTAMEIRQVETYLSVKYGFTIETTSHLYYNEAGYANDIFGLGRELVTQNLNQTTSSSENFDDILQVSNPSNMSDGEYLIFGNQNGALSFSPYAGSNCQISNILGRIWKARETNEVGTTTLRFDLTGMSGFTPERLMLIVDHDNDGFDDENGISGTYNAPYFTVSGVDIEDGELFTIGDGVSTWYAVATGNTSGAIWSNQPNGTPQAIASICSHSNVVIQSGVTVTSDWPTLTCAEFTVSPGGVFNAGSTSLSVNRDLDNNGVFNAQTSSLILNGTTSQNIEGSGITNVYNFTLNNAGGAIINASSGGVRARNYVQITAGTLTTNDNFILMSDQASTGMIGPIVAGDITGNISLNRYHDVNSQGWFGLCSPIQNSTIADWNDDLLTTGFVGSDYPPPYPFTNVQYYSEPAAGAMTAGFVGVTNVTNTIMPGRGYFIYANTGDITVDLAGPIYKGDQVMPTTYTNTGNAAGDGWNLIANPYPCTIDWDSPNWTKTNFDNAVYVWNANSGQYATYINGVAANGGSRYIPHSQAFFVKANSASPALTARELCKSNVQGTFKSTSNPDEVLTLQISNGTHSDETTFSRNENGTLSFENTLDAYKLRSPLEEVPYMASISTEGDDLSINSFGGFDQDKVITLRLEAGITGTYELTYTGLESFAKGACIVLEDLSTGTTYPLNQFETISLELQAGNTEIRFQLHIGASALANITSAGCPGTGEGTAEVNINGGPSDITWINPDGEIIGQETGVTTSASIQNLNPGFYTVQISNNGICGTTETSFFIGSDQNVTATALILPTTCEQDNNGAIALTVQGGTAPYQITWNNGIASATLENVPAGEYTAFITDAHGCDGNFTFEVTSKGDVKSSFETQEEIYSLHNGAVKIDFYNTSENADSYSWNFGDNTIASDESNPQHLFNTPGIYTVTLTARSGDCESVSTRTIKVVKPVSDITDFTSSIMGTLTDQGVQILFFFKESHDIRINAYNVLGQQLIEPIEGTFTNQTIYFSDRRYASNALIEVTDLTTGERAILRMGR